jgi:plastocyanin
MFDSPEFRRVFMRSYSLLIGLLAVSLVACDESFTAPVGNVTVSGTTFSPATVNLTATAKSVTWGFIGGPHNVTFQDGATGSGDRTSGAFTRDFSAAAPGTYRYRCTIHSTDFLTGMVGSVVVP